MKRRRLGQLEAEVLAALAAADAPVSAADLQSRLTGQVAYTTVNTVLFRLLDKHLVTRSKAGRHYLYQLAVDEARLVARQMRDRLDYAADPTDALTQFVASLTPEQEQTLRDLLGDHPDHGKTR